MLRPEVPNRTPVGAANAVGFKERQPRSDATQLLHHGGLSGRAVCELPGAFQRAAAALTENGLPSKAAKTPFTCQSPNTARAAPELANVLPLPAGNLVNKPHL